MNFLKSFLAGVCIGIGATAFLLSGNPFNFVIGIFLVFSFNNLLITGYIPLSVYKEQFNLSKLFLIDFGNLVGAYCFGLVINITRLSEKIKPISETLIQTKTNDSLISIFILAILCGILIGYAVIGTTKTENYLGKMFTLLFPTYIFVVCGFEHMVANIFYIATSGEISISMLFLIVSIIGNIIGGLLIGLIQKYIDKQKTIK